ncbi:MAG: phospholipid carrier-dependent glycosyltransferase [Planctomycetaceae bacterium]|nr:phospholipid carrier-dependent glycosyltransferase [Planctomycetaceae bacterium]
MLSAGLSQVQCGRFDVYRVNPPLVKAVAALPVIAVGCKTDWSRFIDRSWSRSGFLLGYDFIAANGESSLRLMTLARWACIPFSLAGALASYLWASHIYGRTSGLIALSLWCFEPNILAQGHLVTTDAAAAAAGICASYVFWIWLRRQTWGSASCAALALAVALATTLSWLILLFLWPLLFAVWWFTNHLGADAAPYYRVRIGRSAVQLSLIMSLAIYLLCVSYQCDGMFVRLGCYHFTSDLLTGDTGEPGATGNRFAGGLLSDIPVHPTLGHDALLEQDLKTSSPVLAQTPCRTRADGFLLASNAAHTIRKASFQ